MPTAFRCRSGMGIGDAQTVVTWVRVTACVIGTCCVRSWPRPGKDTRHEKRGPMMAQTHLDHPGEVHWFSGYRALPVVGPCPHATCPHNALSTIAHGPDFEHYTLVTCDVQGGCDYGCRAWTVEYPPPFSDARPKFRLAAFLQVAERQTGGMDVTP